jgi:hypothetical protein
MNKIDLVNSLEFIDSDGDGEVLYYVMVENSPEAREVLRKIGVPDVDAYIKEYGEEYYETDTEFDIAPAAFKYTEANYFDGDKFIVLEESK